MSYDEKLALAVRKALAAEPDVVERKMFGGLCFMVRGGMCCGLVGAELMVRVGAARYDEALGMAHARPMDFTGRPLMGMIYVAPAGLRTAAAIAKWVKLGLAALVDDPPKKRKPKKRPPAPFRVKRRTTRA